MTGQHDDDTMDVSAEVRGTPEEVWALLATGPGIATWFMPAEVDGRVGGEMALRHKPGADGVAKSRITAFDPPRRLQFEDDLPDGATLATEFLVEARSGGSCVVRVVTHGIDAIDGGFRDGLVDGWTQALATLRIRLETGTGAPSAFARVWSTREGGDLDAEWAATVRALRLDGAAVGDQVDVPADGHPALAGTVEVVRGHGVVLRTAAPDGVLRVAGTGYGGNASIVVDRYIYAPGGDTAVADEERAWRAYLG